MLSPFRFWIRYLVSPADARERVRRGRRIQEHLKTRLTELERGNPDVSDPVVIYSMGKVGSSTISKSIRINTGCNYPPEQLEHLNLPYQVHSMSPEMIFAGRRATEERYLFLPMPHLQVGWALRTLYVQSGRRLKLIVPLRETVGRNVSSFFEMADSRPRLMRRWLEKDLLDYDPTAMAEILAAYVERHLSYPDNWFARELSGVLGIDIYRSRFDRERGFARLQKGPFEALLLKIELTNEEIERLIGDFIGHQPFTMHRENIGSEKRYRRLYREAKERIRMPRSLLDQCYGSPYMRHFYSGGEIEAFREKWGAA